MKDERFEELLDAYQMEVVELALDPTRVAVVQRSLAHAALVAYFEERTAGIRVTARREDAGYWIADQNDHEPENATLILDEVPR